MLAVLTSDQLAHAMFPIGDTPKARSGPRPPSAACGSPTSPTATTSASSPTATPARSSPRASARGPGRWSTHATGEVLGRHDGVHGFTVGQRKGLGVDAPPPTAGPRYVLGHRAGQRHRPRGAGRRARRRTTIDAAASGVGRRAGAGRPVRVRGPGPRPWRPGRGRRRPERRRAAGGARPSRCAVSRPARRSPSTGPTPAATSCWAAPRSPGRAEVEHRAAHRVAVSPR